jgi:hypothetical protein
MLPLCKNSVSRVESTFTGETAGEINTSRGPCCWVVPSAGWVIKHCGEFSNEELHVLSQVSVAVNDIAIVSKVASPLSGSFVEQLHVFRLFPTSTKCIV